MKLTEKENYFINQIIAVSKGIEKMANVKEVDFRDSMALMTFEIVDLAEQLKEDLKNR